MPKYKETKITKSNPLEDSFDIEEGTTDSYMSVYEGDEQVDSELYDEKDKEIETDFKNISEEALTSFRAILDETDDADPKYLARLYEVASQYLNIALSANDRKAKIKENKDKLNSKKGQTGNTIQQQNVFFENTADLIKKIRAEADADIEGEFKEVSDESDKN